MPNEPVSTELADGYAQGDSRINRRKKGARLRILLTNGRFPVSIDMARQFHKAGHVVFCVDPMEYHVCKFSKAVKLSAQVPAPHDDAEGYVQAVRHRAILWRIDMIFPVHEEIFVLAKSGEPEIRSRLFAPQFDLLVRLHQKWEFTKLMKSLHMDIPEAYLCTSMEDVRKLPVKRFQHGLALKPCMGRASTGVHHLRPDEEFPSDLDVSSDNPYIAQEWLQGTRYCSYTVVREGVVEATGLYPVLDTIDGSSSVYFQQQYHPGIYTYIDEFVARVNKQQPSSVNGQLAFDFVQTANRLVVIECNPRSTSGLHLWSKTPWLAHAITNTLPKEDIHRPITPPKRFRGKEAHIQVAAGMLMWEHKDASFAVWATHMKRLVGSRDVIWRWLDPMPTISQPFLLTTYYRMCKETGLQLPELFQMQVLWEPEGEEMEGLRKLFAATDRRDGEDEADEKEKVLPAAEESNEPPSLGSVV